MRVSLLCRISNATTRAVGRCDRAALGLHLRTSCSPTVASPAIRPSSVGLGGALRWPLQVSNVSRMNTARGIITEASEKQVNHTADNLACTPSENTRHSFDTNAKRKSSAPKQSKPVLGRRRGSEEEWVEYESTMAAARALGLNPGNVSACCLGKVKRTGEYEFKWAPPAEDQHDRPGEEWREVQLECGASRSVSNLGRMRTAKGIVTEGCERTDGYLVVGINGKKHLVHRLVAKAFLEPGPSEKHTIVNHIDGDRANNCADNLRWVTRSEIVANGGCQHESRHQLTSIATNAERKSGVSNQSKPVLGRRHGSEEEWVEYESINAAARALGVDSGSVSRCCLGKVKRAGEYEFKHATEEGYR